MQKQEEDLKQRPKKSAGQGQRGNQTQPDVAHPGERSKIGLKKDPHVHTHTQPAEGERRGRQFERHSGTGRGREIKKGGAGGRNWGKPGDEAAPLPTTTPEPTEVPADEEPAPVEEDPSLTLEQYEALKAAKRSGEAFQQKEARKVTSTIEGKAYKKGEDDGDDVYIKLGEDQEKKKSAHTKQQKAKQVFEIDFNFRDASADAPPRRGRSEGGRGGGSFRGSRDDSRRGGAPRGGRGGRPAPGGAGSINTADQSAFPKLGGSA